MTKVLYLAYDGSGGPLLGVFKTWEAAIAVLEEYVGEMQKHSPEFQDDFCYVEEVKYYDV